jgi:Cytochrome P460
MTKTVWVASNKPTADQIAALHNHWRDSAGLRAVFITRIVFYGAGVAARNAANSQTNAASGIAKARVPRDTAIMIAKMIFALMALVFLGRPVLVVEYENSTAPSNVPEYTGDGQMKVPEHYREWVYLSSGFDMSYSPSAMDMGHHMFDNVFVNPEAYKVFVATGTWPDKTVFMLEARRAEGKGSINQSGNYQGSDVMGREVHVKDSRFPGGWAFFGFGDDKTAKMIPTSARCYSCHQDHGAVDTTFVQFYPTLKPIAKSKGTLAAMYLKEIAEPARQ